MSSELEQAFAIFDRNKDGRISKDEVRNVLMETGVSFTGGQLETFMKKLDTNGKNIRRPHECVMLVHYIPIYMTQLLYTYALRHNVLLPIALPNFRKDPVA